MAAPLAPARRVSVIDAIPEAVELVRQRLFPFRIERWLPLGFVTFLDRCGRSGGGPGGSGGVPDTTGVDTGAPASVDDAIASARDWIADHLVVILALSAILLVVIVMLLAVILWINSRGVFMYVDNVASGRFDVVRPWREHADHAWSYFGWSFGLAIVAFFGVLLLLVPGVLFGLELLRSGPSAGPILGIIALVIAFIVFAIALNLFQLVLRDFAAPLQLALDVRCGRALGVAWTFVRANVLSFVGYVVLKIVFGVVAAIVALFVCCLTCCIGILPVISHTLLQPLYYFERAWSLCLLRQAGYDIIWPAPAPPRPREHPSPPVAG
jgi:hypothetical protein